jgi:hypothetical protein
MATRGGSRKLSCDCGKPLAVFDTRGLNLYCRYSKETTTVPYGIANLAQAIAFVEKLRRQRRRPEGGPGGPGVSKSGH